MRLLLILATISSVNTANASCPTLDKEALQNLYNNHTNTQQFLGSWDNPQERQIIERTLKDFPKENLKPTPDSSNRNLCMYDSTSGAFFTMYCPEFLTSSDIQNIYSNKAPHMSLDNNSKELLNLFFQDLKKYNGQIQSAIFQQNRYQSVQNSCLYNVVSSQTSQGTFSVGVNVILSPAL
jgi:hypothetical protein